MHHTKRSLKFLFLSIISFVLLALLIYYQSPETYFTIAGFQLRVFPFFFLLLFLFLFSTSTFILKSKIHGILIAFLILTYLVFRQNGLTHPFFAVLLLALFLVLELLFTYRK